MPDISQVHSDVALANVSIAYRNPGFIASRLAPEAMVRRQSNKYFVYDPTREALRPADDQRAPGAEAREVDFDVSQESYFCDDHALESPIPDEERENADAPLRPEIERVEFLTDRLLLNQEIALAALLRDPASLPNTEFTLASERWDDDDVDPAKDIEDARGAIVGAIGLRPNVLVLPHDVYTAVRHNPKVVERVKYTRLGIPGPGELAELFDVDEVLVPRATRNTSPMGTAPVLESIWGNDALLLHVPPRAGLKTLSVALTFVWSQARGSLRGHSVATWREERRKATIVRVQKYYDQKLVAPTAGYLFRNAV